MKAVLLVALVATLAIVSPRAAPRDLSLEPSMEIEIRIADCWFFADSLYCTFSVSVTNASITFFRWDIVGDDGVWEYPDQTGGGPLGRWSTQDSVTHAYEASFSSLPPRVCVDGWDGVSSKAENGVILPDSIVDCTGVREGRLEVRPDHWSGRSSGYWVTAFLDLPSEVPRGEVDLATVELEEVPTTAWPQTGTVGGWADLTFKVDRAAVTRLLGPGTHTVILRGAWEDGTFFAADEVTIL